VSQAIYPFCSQPAVSASTGSPHTGFRQVLRCRLHVDHRELSKPQFDQMNRAMPILGEATVELRQLRLL
jgi:hypothetical protein